MTEILARDQLLSVEEYLEMEETSEMRHEYIGGVVYEMPGGTRGHAAIATNALVALGSRLRGKACRPFGSDMKVRIEYPTHTRFYYPDAMVLCTPGPRKSVYVADPVVVIEVASPSTRRTDEQEKREAYLSIPTVYAYLFFEQDFPAATVWRKVDGAVGREWHESWEAVIELLEIGVRLPLAEVYEALDFSTLEEAV